MIWDASSNQDSRLHRLSFARGIPIHAAFSPTKNAAGDYYFVVAPKGDNSARVYNATTGKEVSAPLTYGNSSELQGFLGFSATFNPDSTRIATASHEGRARIWSLPKGDKLFELSGQHSLPISTINYSPDGSRIVTACNDGTAVIWNALTGEFIHRLRHGPEPLNYAEFSPDSQSVVTTSNEGLARIWDSQTGKEMGVPLKHDGFVRTARFSSDNLRIVTCSFDNTARIWDARTGLPLSGPCAMTVTSSGQPSAPMEIASPPREQTLWPTFGIPSGPRPGSRLGSRLGRSGCRIAHR